MKTLIKSIAAAFISTVVSVAAYAQKPAANLLSPTDHALVMIDHESQMAFATKSIDKASEFFTLTTC
ncbi:hypothetical protein [Desertivirga arenae]|uniref:hypothetical protein n=1 Tax=Desertivirga arenae TaxID=2810309 RepID=UPI001A95A2A6|nr:hypothetical protein [Pedobacter sp. SYSU D00823]